ncbi:hypothetical protein [Hyunsoonleella rubra]|uniref:Uncharacterized protein n=1 Tax=Hyunsoonleella rubra TaxID=1737062 RepID=A0ABW5TDB0_9FLAO
MANLYQTKNKYFKLLLLIGLFLGPLTVFSQATPTFGGTQGPTLLSGTLNQQGSRYLYTDLSLILCKFGY